MPTAGPKVSSQLQAIVASGNGTPVPARGDRLTLAWGEDAAVVLADDR